MLQNAVLVLSLLSYALCGALGQFPPSSTESAEYSNRENVNVVLFLADADYGAKCEKDDGLAYLNMSVVAKIKPCIDRPESSLPPSFGKIIRSYQRQACDCGKLLESSIFSLLGWARNAAGMETAVVSLANDRRDKKDGRINYYDYKLEVVDAPGRRPAMESGAFVEFRNGSDSPALGGSEGTGAPKLKLEAAVGRDGVPVMSAFGQEPQMKFNDIHKYHNKFKNLANVHRIKRKLIIEPENTEIINIENVNEEPREVFDIALGERPERPETIWDLLGMISAIKRSFFINFLNPMLDPHRRMLDEESGMNFDALGETRAPSLFQLVKSALCKVQQDNTHKGGSGYLLIVFGGSLSNISDPYSDLVQSIKHVRETTDAESTLVVVTGSCPTNSSNASHYNEQKDRNYRLPVYAKGPNSGYLAEARELFDVPVQIREAIRGNLTEESNIDGQKGGDGRTGKPWMQT